MPRFLTALCFNPIAAVIFLFCLCSCSQEEDEILDEQFRVKTLESGVVEITYGQLPQSRIGLDTLAVLNIWSDEIEYKFSRVASVTGRDSSVYIADGRNLQIVELGLDGQVIQIVGGRGAGPGEFESLQYIDLFGSELWAVDVVSRRYSVFSDSGRYLKGYRWPDSPTQHAPFRALGGGRILFRTSDTSINSPNNIMNLVTLHLETGIIDTLSSMSVPGYARIVLQDNDSPLKQVVHSPPIFSPFLHWALLPDNEVATVATEQYRIDCYTQEGRPTRFIKAVSPDHTVSNRDREWWFEVGFSESQTGKVMGRYGLIPTQESLRTYPFAEKRQAILGMVASPRGWMWVLAATDDPAVNRIDTFNRDGHFQGSIRANTLPRTFLSDSSPVFEIAGPDGLSQYLVCRLDLSQSFPAEFGPSGRR